MEEYKKQQEEEERRRVEEELKNTVYDDRDGALKKKDQHDFTDMY